MRKVISAPHKFCDARATKSAELIRQLCKAAAERDTPKCSELVTQTANVK